MNRLLRIVISSPTHVVRHVTACREARRVADQTAGRLCLSKEELRQFRRKTLNLCLCYLGFNYDNSVTQIRRTAVAAAACAAYDVLTDWKGFSQENRANLKHILRQVADPESVALALTLYDREWQGLIANDGLERGSCALFLVLRMLGSLAYWQSQLNLGTLGLALQVVDDVLDFEADVAKNETNCLTTPHWRDHLRFMKSELDLPVVRQLYVRGPVLWMAVTWAQKKAERFVRQGLPCSWNARKKEQDETLVA